MQNCKWRKIFRVMRLSLILFFCGLQLASAKVEAQAKITVEQKQITYLDLFNQIKEQTGFTVVYSNNELDKNKLVEAGFIGANLKDVLDKILEGTGLCYELMDEFVILKVAPKEEKKMLKITGIVTDKDKYPLPGVTVILKGTAVGTATDTDGRYQLQIPKAEHISLLFSFVGMKSQHILVKAGDELQVKMEEDAEKMNEVVVTGYGVAKKKEVEMSNIKMQEVSVITSRQNVVLDTLVSKDDILHFNQYMEKALRYPKTDLDSNKMGSVILSFELNKKKVPSRIRIEDGFSKESNKEVIRLLAEGPKWENTPSGKRIQARIHFTIGKNGESHKAILEVLPSERKP